MVELLVGDIFKSYTQECFSHSSLCSQSPLETENIESEWTIFSLILMQQSISVAVRSAVPVVEATPSHTSQPSIPGCWRLPLTLSNRSSQDLWILGGNSILSLIEVKGKFLHQVEEFKYLRILFMSEGKQSHIQRTQLGCPGHRFLDAPWMALSGYVPTLSYGDKAQ